MFRFIVLFSVVIAFFSCKKYPENNLWFKAPNNAIIGQWYLEQFTVNGVDSTNFDDVKLYVEKGIDFHDEDMTFTEQYEGDWKLSKKKKDITMNSMVTGPTLFYVAQKNLFRDNQSWKIEKLTKSAFWLSVTNGSSSYVVKLKH
jgi:hypothetical protein